MFWYNTSSEVTKGKKKKEREGMVLISSSTNPYKHLASYPERKKKKKALSYTAECPNVIYCIRSFNPVCF